MKVCIRSIEDNFCTAKLNRNNLDIDTFGELRKKQVALANSINKHSSGLSTELCQELNEHFRMTAHAYTLAEDKLEECNNLHEFIQQCRHSSTLAITGQIISEAQSKFPDLQLLSIDKAEEADCCIDIKISHPKNMLNDIIGCLLNSDIKDLVKHVVGDKYAPKPRQISVSD